MSKKKKKKILEGFLSRFFTKTVQGKMRNIPLANPWVLMKML